MNNNVLNVIDVHQWVIVVAAKYFVSIFALVVLHLCGPQKFHAVLCTYILCVCVNV